MKNTATLKSLRILAGKCDASLTKYRDQLAEKVQRQQVEWINLITVLGVDPNVRHSYGFIGGSAANDYQDWAGCRFGPEKGVPCLPTKYGGSYPLSAFCVRPASSLPNNYYSLKNIEKGLRALARETKAMFRAEILRTRGFRAYQFNS